MIGNIKNITSLIGVLIICLQVGCKGPTGPTGAEGPNHTGDLIGHAYLFDANGNKLKDNSGIVISIDGKGISTTSAYDGRWVLSSLSTGTYTLSFSKPGYGTTKAVGVQFIGGGQLYLGSITLGQTPAFVVNNLLVNSSGNQLTIRVTLSGSLPTNGSTVRLFVGAYNNVSSDPSTYFYSTTKLIDYPLTSFSFSLDPSAINPYGFYSGRDVYFVAYADSWYSSSYIDISTGQLYYPNLNPISSNVMSNSLP